MPGSLQNRHSRNFTVEDQYLKSRVSGNKDGNESVVSPQSGPYQTMATPALEINQSVVGADLGIQFDQKRGTHENLQLNNNGGQSLLA